METKSHTNGVANSLPVNTGGGSQNPQDPASHSMQSQGRKPGQSQILLANQSQVRQQLFSQNIQCCVGDSGIQASVALSSALPSGASLTQFSMPNAVSQGSNMQSGMSQNFSGNLVGEGGVASNMFANSTRQMQGRKLPQQTASQQQQSLSSQQFLYQQQHLLKQKQQQQQLQGNIPSIMQSHMQQQPQLQQQNPIQSTHLQSTLQTHMKMSFGLQPCQSTLQRTWPFAMQSSSGLQQKRQPAFAQSTPNVQQHPQSVIRQPQQQSQQSMHQQAPVLHQQQHPVLPSQQQINAPNLQQNQLIGKQNDVLNMQQRGLVNQQTNVTNMQQYLLGNNIPYQQQLGQQSNMSGLQKQQQQPMHTMHQQGGKAQQQQNAQVSPNMLQFQGKHAQSQPAQQLMSQHPSQTTQMHKQLGLQQQPKSLQSYMQQRIQTSGGSMLNHQSLLDHKQVFHSQTPPPEASSTSIDALMTGNATATGTAIDMQEEVYQTIKSMREKYLPDLSDMRWKISQICQQYDSLPQPPKSEGIELLKNFKIVVDRMMGFLNLPKSNVIPSMKDKLDSYEKQILDILTLHPPRKPGPPQQQIQPTGGHPLSIQQQQEQQQQHQLPSSTSIDAVITGNATATGSLVDVQEEVYQTYDSLPQPPKCEEIELLKNFKIVVEKMMGFFLALMILVEKTTLHCFHRASIDAAITGNAVDVQEDVYQTIKFMREKYLPDLNKMHQKISLICEQYDSLPQPPKSEQIERLKMFKNLLDQMMGFLNLRKSSVMPSFKDKLVSYEKHIIDILNSNRPRELDD
ncbi:mediator of RNA polymerase II transcription subunit 15a-like [Papaver somniferum]|uniref:mediator of RNA polymerase II transcription subunit 15a-like n=1 Tax=Papaver somniferum TaxID=3469 RepID=UPI000E6F502F|nr:mediator of RNA polymerase II transcription subunit 15a-like [Papaver somniferum]